MRFFPGRPTLRRPLLTGSTLTSALLASVLLLTSCGGDPVPVGSAPLGPKEAPPATPGGSATAPRTTSPASNPGRCRSAQLTGSTAPGGGGAAGTAYATLVLSNTSGSPCLLSGFAGLSLTDGPEGAPIGAPADRDETGAPVVDILLKPGESSTAEFGYRYAGNFEDCTLVDAAGLRVHPPDDTGSLFIPLSRKACAEDSVHLLTLRAFQPG